MDRLSTDVSGELDVVKAEQLVKEYYEEWKSEDNLSGFKILSIRERCMEIHIEEEPRVYVEETSPGEFIVKIERVPRTGRCTVLSSVSSKRSDSKNEREDIAKGDVPAVKEDQQFKKISSKGQDKENEANKSGTKNLKQKRNTTFAREKEGVGEMSEIMINPRSKVASSRNRQARANSSKSTIRQRSKNRLIERRKQMERESRQSKLREDEVVEGRSKYNYSTSGEEESECLNLATDEEESQVDMRRRSQKNYLRKHSDKIFIGQGDLKEEEKGRKGCNRCSALKASLGSNLILVPSITKSGSPHFRIEPFYSPLKENKKGGEPLVFRMDKTQFDTQGQLQKIVMEGNVMEDWRNGCASRKDRSICCIMWKYLRTIFTLGRPRKVIEAPRRPIQRKCCCYK